MNHSVVLGSRGKWYAATSWVDLAWIIGKSADLPNKSSSYRNRNPKIANLRPVIPRRNRPDLQFPGWNLSSWSRAQATRADPGISSLVRPDQDHDFRLCLVGSARSLRGVGGRRGWWDVVGGTGWWARIENRRGRSGGPTAGRPRDEHRGCLNGASRYRGCPGGGGTGNRPGQLAVGGVGGIADFLPLVVQSRPFEGHRGSRVGDLA